MKQLSNQRMLQVANHGLFAIPFKGVMVFLLVRAPHSLVFVPVAIMFLLGATVFWGLSSMSEVGPNANFAIVRWVSACWLVMLAVFGKIAIR